MTTTAEAESALDARLARAARIGARRPAFLGVAGIAGEIRRAKRLVPELVKGHRCANHALLEIVVRLFPEDVVRHERHRPGGQVNRDRISIQTAADDEKAALDASCVRLVLVVLV